LARVLRLFRAEVYLPLLPEIPTHEPGAGVFLRVAEVGLVLLLFTGASRTELWVLCRIENLPLRLLTAGMLLTIALGTAAALGMGLIFHGMIEVFQLYRIVDGRIVAI
jgi:hypothetical protein